MYFLRLSFIPEEDPTFLYFILVTSMSCHLQSDKFCFPVFTFNCMLELALCSAYQSTATPRPSSIQPAGYRRAQNKTKKNVSCLRFHILQ